MKKKLLGIIVWSILLSVMTGCSYLEFEDGVKAKREQKKAEERRETYYENVGSVQMTEATENVEGGTELSRSLEYIEIKSGPNEIAEDYRGEVNYRIDNVRFYEHFKDNDCGILETDLLDVDIANENVREQGFLLMDVTIENVSNVGSNPSSEVPYINISTITLQSNERVAADGTGWCGTYPNYFDKGVDDEKYGYCIPVEQGETEKIMLGFLVPTNVREELTNYVLDYNLCQRYEIPAISN